MKTLTVKGYKKELFEVLRFAIRECKKQLKDSHRQCEYIECEEMRNRIDCYEYVLDYMKAWEEGTRKE
jgi:hypothetical protein